ncbi:MAG: WXG100 family type VII secretion target [Rhodococcus sp. (in: high G+C Gram-positive bacteria)]
MSSGNGYSYDHNAARDAEDRVQQAATNLEQSVSELSDSVRALSSSWEGGEQGDYMSVQMKVDSGHQAITQILAQLRNVLGENSQQVMGMQNTISSTLLNG